jgi:hypothetical protein
VRYIQIFSMLLMGVFTLRAKEVHGSRRRLFKMIKSNKNSRYSQYVLRYIVQGGAFGSFYLPGYFHRF